MRDALPVPFRGGGFAPRRSAFGAAATLLGLLALWQAAAAWSGINPLFLPSPLAVARAYDDPHEIGRRSDQIFAIAAMHGHVADAVASLPLGDPGAQRVVGFTGGGHWSHDPAGNDLLAAGAFRVFREFRDLAEVVANA